MRKLKVCIDVVSDLPASQVEAEIYVAIRKHTGQRFEPGCVKVTGLETRCVKATGLETSAQCDFWMLDGTARCGRFDTEGLQTVFGHHYCPEHHDIVRRELDRSGFYFNKILGRKA